VLVSTQKRFAPYWRVTIDGSGARTLAANGAFLAVALPAGRHVVDGRFDVPPAELVVSAAGALALLAAAVAARRPRPGGRAAGGNLKESAAR
jgi:hypothetical protein